MIVAKGANDAIGNKGALPWKCPEDWEFFLQTTKGFPVIMGRNVYAELPKGAYNGWTKLVLSETDDFSISDGTVFTSLPGALEYARNHSFPHIFIIGGERPYEEGLGLADDLYLTFMHAIFEADTYFPPMDYDRWKIKEEGPVIQVPEVPFPYQFTWWQRES